MTVKARQGTALKDMPIEVPSKTEDAADPRPKSKQTIEIDRRALARIKSICTSKGMSFQDFAIEAISEHMQNKYGEPSIKELEGK